MISYIIWIIILLSQILGWQLLTYHFEWGLYESQCWWLDATVCYEGGQAQLPSYKGMWCWLLLASSSGVVTMHQQQSCLTAHCRHVDGCFAMVQIHYLFMMISLKPFTGCVKETDIYLIVRCWNLIHNYPKRSNVWSCVLTGFKLPLIYTVKWIFF